jgi:hypothetical protein
MTICQISAKPKRLWITNLLLKRTIYTMRSSVSLMMSVWKLRKRSRSVRKRLKESLQPIRMLRKSLLQQKGLLFRLIQWMSLKL